MSGEVSILTVTINGKTYPIIKRGLGSKVYTAFYRKGVLWPFEDEHYQIVGHFLMDGEYIAYTKRVSIIPTILFALLSGLLLLTLAYASLPYYMQHIKCSDTAYYNPISNKLALNVNNLLLPIDLQVITEGANSELKALAPQASVDNINMVIPTFKEDMDATLRLTAFTFTVDKPLTIKEDTEQ